MLQFIRKGLSSPIALGILALVVVAFIITGVGDPFAGSNRAGEIASVGKRTIAEPDLMRALDAALRNAREQNPGASLASIAREGAVELVADQLVGRAALEAYAEETLKLGASEPAIGAVIAGLPAFQLGGKFDQATYDRVLAESRLSDRQLRADIAGDIRRRALLTPLTTALNMPAGMALPLARQLVDVRRGAVAVVPPAEVKPATPAEVEAFYTENRTRFTVPERRGFRWALVSRESIASTVSVSDADIAAAFAKTPERYGAAEARPLLQVVVPDEATAKAIAAAAATEGFAAAAQRLAGFGRADIELGFKTEKAFAAETAPDVARAAFALGVGGVSAPVRSPFGWHVLSLAGTPRPAASLAQVSDAIRADLRDRAVQDALSAMVARIEDAAEAGKSFSDIATSERLDLFSQPPVTREGTGLDTPQVSGLVSELLPLAFAQLPEDGITVQQLDGGRLAIIETTRVEPAAPRPLKDIRPLVEALATRDKAVKAARATAEKLLATVKAGTPLIKATADAGLPPAQPLTGRRIDVAGQEQISPLIQAFLSTPAGTTRIIGGIEGWALVQVESIEPGDPAAVPGLVDALRRETAQVLPNEFAEAVAAAAERATKARRNTSAIAAIRRRLEAQASADPAS
jgi:peptidyl-prolyl cis-trans isomerase D